MKSEKEKLFKVAFDKAVLKLPTHIAAALNFYKQKYELDDSQLAEKLGLSLVDYYRLGLCGNPFLDLNVKSEEVIQICDYIGVDEVKLRTVMSEAVLSMEYVEHEMAKEGKPWKPFISREEGAELRKRFKNRM